MNHQHALPPVPIWKLIVVACAGGFVGSAARAGMELGCSSVGLPGWSARVVVNVLGACAIGVLFARLCDVDGRGIPVGFSQKNRLREQLWGAGFLGGFTTVSGFAWDVASAVQDGAFDRAAVLFTADAVVGIAAAALGYSITMARRATLRCMPDITLNHLVADVSSGTVRPCQVTVRSGRIVSIVPSAAAMQPGVLVPGFVDAHVHVESSMLPPWEFARVAMRHGTVASVSDPHEIANVLGEPGIRFMIEDIAGSPFTCWFGCPSCVPATSFETAGATIGADACARLLDDPNIHYLSEMMNWPGAIGADAQVMSKIAAAHARGKRVDGHAPGLRGEQARAYFARGIETDHECFTLDEARDKAALGVKILIRDGSAARNFDALWPMLAEHPELCMFCTDDAHPDDLLVGHIDRLLARAVAKGIDPFVALRAATLNPIRHYGLPCGLLREGDRADMVLVEDLLNFKPVRTWIAGELVSEGGRSCIAPRPSRTPNAFRAGEFVASDFRVLAPVRGAGSDTSNAPVIAHAIVAEDGQLVTGSIDVPMRITNGVIEPDPSQDLLLIAVVNRYSEAPPAMAFIRGFGLTHGAIASSVAHDCHNVVAVGASREAVAHAVNAVFAERGGLAVSDGSAAGTQTLALPIAGLMSDRPAEEVGAAYAQLSKTAKRLGSPLRAPYMTAGFMALLVIPALKLSDRGLFDGSKFAFTPAVI